jgi:hypothetical protein
MAGAFCFYNAGFTVAVATLDYLASLHELELSETIDG